MSSFIMTGVSCEDIAKELDLVLRGLGLWQGGTYVAELVEDGGKLTLTISDSEYKHNIKSILGKVRKLPYAKEIKFRERKDR